MIDFIQWIGAVGGIGAVFAVILFCILMKVMKTHHEEVKADRIDYTDSLREDRKFMEDRLTNILKDYNEALKDTRESIRENTQVNTELITYLKAKNGNKG